MPKSKHIMGIEVTTKLNEDFDIRSIVSENANILITGYVYF